MNYLTKINKTESSLAPRETLEKISIRFRYRKVIYSPKMDDSSSRSMKRMSVSVVSSQLILGDMNMLPSEREDVVGGREGVVNILPENGRDGVVG